ncbi:MAG: hypothetical protein R3B93_25615 [Bacteroidia bacterium]
MERKVLSAAGAVSGPVQISEITKSGFIKMRYSAFDPELATVTDEKLISGLDQYYQEQKTEERGKICLFHTKSRFCKSELDKVNRTIAIYYDRAVWRKNNKEYYPREMTMRRDHSREMYITLEINKEQAKAQLRRKRLSFKFWICQTSIFNYKKDPALFISL